MKNRNRYLPFETLSKKAEKRITIPDKLYFRISEVSKLTGLEPYVLRYWESEFKSVKPIRTKSRHRLYRRKDLHIIFAIKRLLYEEQYTIAGAKKRLEEIIREERKEAHNPEMVDLKKVLLDMIEELKSLRKSLT